MCFTQGWELLSFDVTAVVQQRDVQIYKKVQFTVNSYSRVELKLNKTCLYLFIFLYDGSMSLSLLFCLFNVLSPHLFNLQTTIT